MLDQAPRRDLRHELTRVVFPLATGRRLRFGCWGATEQSVKIRAQSGDLSQVTITLHHAL
jgi:hypothetical protein